MDLIGMISPAGGALVGASQVEKAADNPGAAAVKVMNNTETTIVIATPIENVLFICLIDIILFPKSHRGLILAA